MNTGLSGRMIVSPARKINCANLDLTRTTVWSIYFLDCGLCRSRTPFIERIRFNDNCLHSVVSITRRTRSLNNQALLKCKSKSFGFVKSDRLIFIDRVIFISTQKNTYKNDPNGSRTRDLGVPHMGVTPHMYNIV